MKGITILFTVLLLALVLLGALWIGQESRVVEQSQLPTFQYPTTGASGFAMERATVFPYRQASPTVTASPVPAEYYAQQNFAAPPEQEYLIFQCPTQIPFGRPFIRLTPVPNPCSNW